MTDEPSSSGGDDKPAPSSTRPARTSTIPAALVALALLVAGGYWVVSKHRARGLSRELFDRATAFVACVNGVRGDRATLRDAVSFTSPRATPLAICQTELGAVRDAHSRLLGLSLRRDRDGAARMGEELASIAAVPFAAPSETLLSADLNGLESNVDAAGKSACRIAIAEGAIEVGGCAGAIVDRDPPPPPKARLVLDQEVGWLVDAALAVDARSPERLRLMLVLRDRDHARMQARWLESSDRGDHFAVAELEAGLAEPGAPETPRLISDPRTGKLVRAVFLQRDRTGQYAGGSAVDFGERGAGEAALLPPPPAGLEPVRVGAPMIDVETKKGRRPAVAFAPVDPAAQGGALVILEDGGRTRDLATPAGRLVAVGTGGEPFVLVSEQSREGTPTLARYVIPEAGKAWPGASGVAAITADFRVDPAPETSVGLENEKYFPFVAHQPGKAVLVAVGSDRIQALGFDEPPATTLSLVRGDCPPSLVAGSDARIDLMFPVGNRITPIPVDAPCLVAETKAGKSARAACTSRSFAVTYVSNGRVIVQVSQPGRWSFSAPKVLAEPDVEGRPTEAWVAAPGGRIVVIWRRDRQARQRLRLELAASDDGGGSWH